MKLLVLFEKKIKAKNLKSNKFKLKNNKLFIEGKGSFPKI